MEKIKNLKAKLIAAILSTLVCFMIVVISVFAAITQSVTINDSITILTDDQARVNVTVSAKLGETDKVLLGSEDSDYTKVKSETFSNPVTLDYKTSGGSANGSGLTPIFKESNGYTYYVYKIELENEGANANYVIAVNNLAENEQIRVAYANESSWGEGTLLTGTINKDTSVEIYIVYALKVGFEYLNASSTDEFTLTVDISIPSPEEQR